MEIVLELVPEALKKMPAQIRNASIYLCRKYTCEKLRTIGRQFGISDAAVSQVCKRFDARIDIDRSLRREIAKLEKTIRLLKVET